MSRPWWQDAVIYQIYPRSFQDATGDGVGDLAGARRRLDYLAWLGVDAIWLSPFYPSPMADFGYDVADYTGVDPLFGTLADFDALLRAARDRGIKVICDLVPNHSSDRHPWFIASRSSRADPKRDWYLWRDPAPGGGPPNNWLSVFGGSAWAWDEGSGQYYYHAFLPEQPDLNWRHPGVRRAMHDAMRFWLNRGVAGFRVDVLWYVIKDALWRDNPPNPDYDPARDPPFARLRDLYSTDQPEAHEVTRGMRAVLDEYEGDRVLIAELYLPNDRLARYFGRGDEAHLPFNFQLVEASWDAEAIAEIVRDYEASLPAGCWPNWVLGNHDRSRVATRFGPERAGAAAVLLLTLRGTPTLYYGDEIGMRDQAIAPDRVRDPQALRQPGVWGRDAARTPMRWGAGPGAGFSSAEHTWLPLGDDLARINVESMRADPDSLLHLYRALLAERRASRALREGRIERVRAERGVLRYERVAPRERWEIAIHMGDREASIEAAGAGSVVVATAPARRGAAWGGAESLGPGEAIVARLSDGRGAREQG